MIKVIGEQKIFAIQYEIIEVIDKLILGRICYFIEGMQIGNFDEVTILSDSFLFVPQIIKDNGNREHEVFFKMKKEKIYYLLGGQAYLDDYKKYEEIALAETWARFHIDMSLDVLDNMFAVLIDKGDRSRIVFMGNDQLVHDFELDRGVVDKVFLIFYNELNNFYEEQVLRKC